MTDAIPNDPPTVEGAQDEIVQYAAIMASMLTPNAAADFLDEVSRDLRSMQPAGN